MTFKELNLSAPLLRAVQEAGYETPSPIQAAAIPPVLSGRDLMAAPRPVPARRLLCAAHAGPAHGQCAPQKGCHPRLILTPTRELALQIGESFDATASISSCAAPSFLAAWARHRRWKR